MNTYKPTTQVSIVGYGRFGKVLHRLLKNDFRVVVYQRGEIVDRSEFDQNTTVATRIEDIYKSDVIFYAVPIESFGQVIANHKRYFRDGHLLVDVLSVKLHPAKVFEKHLKGSKIQAMLTHPMFGPDSSKEGFEGLPIILDKFTTNSANFHYWKTYFISKKLRVVELTARQHDKLAADSQGLTHFLGRLVDAYGTAPTVIDSLGTKKLLEIKDQTCNDTWQLFTNLQHYNPYTAHMRVKLGRKFDRLYNRLLPRHIQPGHQIFGIQGGRGSFNEEALMQYIRSKGIREYKIKYLYTSANVLRALHKGLIDKGQFAIYNQAGGMVEESLRAMANFRFKIIDSFTINISHALMIRKNADISDITTIITHPQVLAQCKTTLASKYHSLNLMSGQGAMIDHSLVAKHLGEKRLPKHIATMGSRILADVYGLKVVDDNLQDLRNNETSFMQVERI